MSDKPAKTRKTAAPAEKPLGRPSSFTQEIANQICERMASGQSLRFICVEHAMPTRTTVYRWLEANAEFRDQYARASELRTEELFDQIIEIADDGLNDTYVDDEGNRKTDTDVLARSKLRVEARKWALSKMAPKKYGDKLQTELSGPDGKPIEFTGITRRIVKAP